MQRVIAFVLAAIVSVSCIQINNPGNNDEDITAVLSVAVSPASSALVEGETLQLEAIITPEDATDKTLTWVSSAPSVASVSESGFVTALSEGTASITATAGGKSGTSLITVSKKVVHVTEITIDPQSVELEEGDNVNLTATVKPDDATERTITWTSSNQSVAKVDSGGKVTAVSKGSAVITASADGQSATCAVNVKGKYIPVTSVTLNKSSMSINRGSSAKLTATVKPNNATNKTVTWTSSAPDVASVDDTGNVTAKAAGECVITASAEEKTASCKVTVVIPVQSLSIDKTSLDMLKGQTEKITATVGPEDATDKTVTWSSTNSGVASVDAQGLVTAKKAGSATIKAKAGSITVTCQVNVTVPVSSVILNTASLTLQQYTSCQLMATVSPDDASDKTVTWNSSAPNIASVDQNGLVKALNAGEAVITAKAGDFSATCTITVTLSSNGGNEGIGYDD